MMKILTQYGVCALAVRSSSDCFRLPDNDLCLDRRSQLQFRSECRFLRP